MGVLNLMPFNVSADKGENMPLSKLPTPPIAVPVEKLRRGVSGRGREFEVPENKPVLFIIEEVGVCVVAAKPLDSVSVEEDCEASVVPRSGVTKSV